MMVGKSGLRRSSGGPCSHCSVTVTPCWRKGPPEKPILCNACGARYLVKRTLDGYMPGQRNGAPTRHKRTNTRERKNDSSSSEVDPFEPPRTNKHTKQDPEHHPCSSTASAINTCRVLEIASRHRSLRSYHTSTETVDHLSGGMDDGVTVRRLCVGMFGE